MGARTGVEMDQEDMDQTEPDSTVDQVCRARVRTYFAIYFNNVINYLEHLKKISERLDQ